MKVIFIDEDRTEEVIKKNITEDEAVQLAKYCLEDHFEQNEIDEERFYISESLADENKTVKQVYVTANSFGILSDAYVDIRKE